MSREDLPVEVSDNELPSDDEFQHGDFFDDKEGISGGFANIIFLGAIMAVCFLWGMLVVILK